MQPVVSSKICNNGFIITAKHYRSETSNVQYICEVIFTWEKGDGWWFTSSVMMSSSYQTNFIVKVFKIFFHVYLFIYFIFARETNLIRLPVFKSQLFSSEACDDIWCNGLTGGFPASGMDSINYRLELSQSRKWYKFRHWGNSIHVPHWDSTYVHAYIFVYVCTISLYYLTWINVLKTIFYYKWLKNIIKTHCIKNGCLFMKTFNDSFLYFFYFKQTVSGNPLEDLNNLQKIYVPISE